jgi:aminopeptidase N
MLRDMVGEPALKRALAAYRPEEDKSPSYVQKLIEAQSHLDLEWFFDDWVYRDRGLPDFEVKTVYPRRILPSGYMVTVTIENLGAAGAEVPITLQFADGERMRRIDVHGKAEASIRFEIPSLPEKVIVNDGSVPESNMTNNEAKVTVAAPAEEP